MNADRFKKQYFSLHPRLYKVAYAILNNAENAEDILQDLYYKLWNDRKKLSEISKPEAYCITVVKNLCLDFIRLQKNKHKEDINENNLSHKVSYTLEKEIEDKETLNKVKSIINSLPEKQRRILYLRGFADCELEEIEKITGESSANVRVLLSRARKTLKTKIKHLEHD